MCENIQSVANTFAPSIITLIDPRPADVARAVVSAERAVVIFMSSVSRAVLSTLYNYSILSREEPPAIGSFMIPSYNTSFTLPVAGNGEGGDIFGVRFMGKNIYLVPIRNCQNTDVVEIIRLLSTVNTVSSNEPIAAVRHATLSSLLRVTSPTRTLRIKAVCGVLKGAASGVIKITTDSTVITADVVVKRYPIKAICDGDNCYDVDIRSWYEITFTMQFTINEDRNTADPILPFRASHISVHYGRYDTCHENVSSEGAICTGSYNPPPLRLDEEICGQVRSVAMNILEILSRPNVASAYRQCDAAVFASRRRHTEVFEVEA